MMRFWGCESLFWTILWRRRSLQFQWARARFFCVCTIMLDKETWRKECWSLLFICSLVWFLYTAKCEFSSKLRVYIKDWSPSRGSGATVGLIFPEIFVSPLSEFEQHMYSSDPRPDTGSLMQLERRRPVPQASQPPKSQPRHLKNSTTQRPRSEKPLQTSGSKMKHPNIVFPATKYTR